MFDIGTLPITNYIVIGSYALNTRLSKDVDIVCQRSDIQDSKINIEYEDKYILVFWYQGKKIECLLTEEQESLKVIYNLIVPNLACEYNTHYYIADSLLLFVLKAGHIFFNTQNWEKHIHDYVYLYKLNNFSQYTDFNEVLFYQDRRNDITVTTKELIDLHYKSTTQREGKQRLPRLSNTTVEEFFDDAVTKYIEHDRLHEIFAHTDVPMYTKMQKNKQLVDCDYDLWKKFTHKQKLFTVYEECYVIASERMIIPNIVKNKQYDSKSAFKWALRRVCTDLASGWFRQFAVDHYFTLLNNYDINYVDKIKGLTYGNDA